MEYKEFKDFWEKVITVKDVECRKSCAECTMGVYGCLCCTLHPEGMTEEQFNFVQNYSLTDWSKVPIDTKIVVRMGDDKIMYKRHFAGYENGVIYAWDAGQTSFTAAKKVAWKYAELYQEEP